MLLCSRESLEAKPVIPLHPVTHPYFLCPQCWKSLTTTFCLRLGLGGLGIRTLGPIRTHQRSIVFIALQMNLLTLTTRERSSRSCISAIILQMHVRDRSHCVYKGGLLGSRSSSENVTTQNVHHVKDFCFVFGPSCLDPVCRCSIGSLGTMYVAFHIAFACIILILRCRWRYWLDWSYDMCCGHVLYGIQRILFSVYPFSKLCIFAYLALWLTCTVRRHSRPACHQALPHILLHSSLVQVLSLLPSLPPRPNSTNSHWPRTSSTLALQPITVNFRIRLTRRSWTITRCSDR